MKFDLTKFPVGDDDNQLKDERGEKPVTYREVFMKCLVAEPADAMGRSTVQGEERFNRFDLWQRFKHASRLIELDPKEIITCTNAARDAFPIIIGGQCRDFLKKPEQDVSENQAR